jgi:sec-independent protein translocase protein TatA
MVLTILLGILGGQEIIIIALILLLLFGGRKIPELMKGLGKAFGNSKMPARVDQKVKNMRKEVSH